MNTPVRMDVPDGINVHVGMSMPARMGVPVGINVHVGMSMPAWMGVPAGMSVPAKINVLIRMSHRPKSNFRSG